MKLLTILSVIAFLSAFAAGSPIANTDNRIYGEGAALCGTGQFPYLVSVKVDNSHKCGGWIYNERFIVTAASCVQGLSPASVVVTVAENVLNEAEGTDGKQNFIVQSITTYKSPEGDEYSPATGVHNIALVQTISSINLGNVSVADFADYGERPAGLAVPALIAGWGETSAGSGQALRCRTVNITIATDNQCFAGFGEQYNSTFQMCSTLGGISNACNGDEGGPVMQTVDNKLVVTGVIAKIIEGCTAFTSVGISKISHYYNWLTQTAGRQPIRP